MLSRSGSSASSNLQRTKSTTSVKERRRHPLQAQSIDPQTARVHALIAAHRAVDRSRASTSTEIARTNSLLSKKSFTTSQEPSVTFSPASHLRRQRSTLQNRVPKLADTLQLPGDANERRKLRKQYECSVEFGISGENYSAEPSSYRKLKRSKSLLSPIRQTYQPFDRSPETTLSKAPTLRTATSSVALKSPGLKVRLKRSLNFLRQTQSATRIVTAPAQLQHQNPYHPEALTLARNQYLDQLNKQEVDKKPSISFSSRTKKAQKAFRKTFRTGNDFQGDATTKEFHDLTKHEKGSLSVSLGHTVRRIFGKSKQIDQLPPQQLEAQKPHFYLDLNTPSPEAGFDSYLNAETQSSKRDSSCTPNAYVGTGGNAPQLRQQLSQAGSCESLSSNSRSRVTSWTNSTVADSVSTRPTGYEPKRLSVIKEDGGPHQPSSSAGRHIGGVSVFQQPLNVPQGQNIDSQRVYSALLKRINEEQKEIERTSAALKEIHDARDQDEVIGHYLFSAPTIRRVESRGSATLSILAENETSSRERASSRGSKHSTLDIDHGSLTVKKRTAREQVHIVLPVSDPISHIQWATSSEPSPQDVKEALTSSHSENEIDSVLNTNDSISRYGKGSRFARSTESVYSRTTNGGTNVDYVSPIGSTQELGVSNGLNQDIATIIHSRPSITPENRSLRRSGLSSGDMASENTSWRIWMEHHKENSALGRGGSKPATHFREHAQIDPEDTSIGRNQDKPPLQQPYVGNLATTNRSYQDPHIRESVNVLGSFSKPGLQLKEVLRNHPPAPCTNNFVRRSQSALFNYDNSALQPVSLAGKATGLRKISPGNVSRMLKLRKSQPALLKRQSPGKENNPVRIDESQPVSTPGRHSIRMQLRDVSDQVRDRESKTGFRKPGVKRENQQWHTPPSDSSSDKAKVILSARLSKPFDMDVPDHNRPFDSMYLGKRKLDCNGRLSVAPIGSREPQAKTYGNLGPPPLTDGASSGDTDSNKSEPTALPPLSAFSNAQKLLSDVRVSSAGKRIVSTFLRSRKNHDGSDIASSTTSNAAFI